MASGAYNCYGTGVNGWCDSGNMRIVFGRYKCSGPFFSVATVTMPASFASTNYTLVASINNTRSWYSTEESQAKVTSENTFRAYCASTEFNWSYIATGFFR